MIALSPRRTPRLVALLAFITTFCGAAAARPALAQGDIGETVYLRGRLQAERVELLREEFRERQREIRESIERAKHAKRGHGKKAEQAFSDPDYYTGPGAASRVAPARIGGSLVAPTNVMTNNKAGDAAGVGQAEQSPVFVGQNGLCAWNDGQGFVTPPDVQGFGWTVDGGATWTDGGVPLKQGTIASWSSDPVTTANEKTGDFYYCGLTTNSGTNNNGVAVMRGHFAAGTLVQDASTQVAAGPSSSQSFDKEWMCADSLNGNLYVTWTLFTPGATTIYFSRSTNNGASWSAPLQINGTWEAGLVSGSRPMVGPNGEVYVQYTAIGPVDADSVKIAKSTDNGATFSPAVVALIEYDNYFNGAPGFNRPRAVTFCSGAVDRSTGPNRGRVYMTIQDCVNFYNDGLFINSGKSEVEPNSGFANATPFTIGQTLRGSMTLTSDQDWYKFPATSGTTYIFYVDSLRTTNLRYTMRLYCPNDTTILSRLAFSGAQATTSAQNSHSLIVWTAPTTNTYYLRMVPVTVSAINGGYRILTATHTPTGSDVARDTRDVVESHSADGQTGWSARQIVNDDVALYDNWLPEVAVPCDGMAYLMWFDWRDTPASCFGGSNVYLSRSTNGGGTWSASQVVTTAVTANWTQVLSNIAPNQGDYNGMYGGDCVAMAFADGRTGDADVFAARLTTGSTLTGCPGDQIVTVGTPYDANLTLTNLNQMFGNTYTYSVSVNVNWPGFPAGGNLGLGAQGNGPIPIHIAPPDSAQNGEVVRVCVTVSLNGACVQTCCFNVTVVNPATPTLASLIDASASGGTVKLSWQLGNVGAARLYRSTDRATWTFLSELEPNGLRRVSYEDQAVTPGQHYWYHLIVSAPGGDIVVGEVAIEVPVNASFALVGARPNPSPGRMSISFSLADNSAARIEVIDLMGRRVFDREVGSMGPGFHVLAIGEDGALRPGIYAVRLSQHSRTLTSKVSVIN